MATTTAVGQAGRRLTQSSSSAARLAQSTTSSTSSSTSPTLAALHRRTALATRQATRRRTRDQDREERREGWKLRQEAASRNASRRELVRAERLARRQDWEMGALAPNRDLTARATYGATPYGALPGGLSRGTEVMKKLRTKEWGIVVGDRVVVVGEGHRDQGKIGKVVQVYEESEEVSVERVNVANVAIPEWQRQQESDKGGFRAMPIPIPLGEVRLVAPITDTDSGSTQDAIIESMSVKPARWVNGVKIPGQRFVATPSGRLEIPYPEEQEAEKSEYDLDTLRIEVEERSWTPTLSVPPMPPSIIDELRNKYSKFRTHHDDDWVEAKDAELLRKQLRLGGMQNKMVSPLEERRRVKEAEKMASGDEGLEDAVLEGIGRVMARNLRLNDTLLAQEGRAEEVEKEKETAV